jgi:hypothetical protein
MANAPRIPLQSADDLYAKLKREHARLQAGWSTDDSFNFIVTAYHLYDDWARRAGTRAQQQRRNRLDPIAERLMHVLRDITNASKHWKLDAPNERKRVVGEVSSARIADWHSYFITGPQIYVTDVDGASLSMSTISRLTMEVFRWIMEGTDNTFPPDLRRKLETAFQPLIKAPAG